MLGVDADHAYHALAVDDLALITHLFYRGSHLHYFVLKTRELKAGVSRGAETLYMATIRPGLGPQPKSLFLRRNLRRDFGYTDKLQMISRTWFFAKASPRYEFAL